MFFVPGLALFFAVLFVRIFAAQKDFGRSRSRGLFLDASMTLYAAPRAPSEAAYESAPYQLSAITPRDTFKFG
jgi:hypothetical protein